jgi:hypothetical protein
VLCNGVSKDSDFCGVHLTGSIFNNNGEYPSSVFLEIMDTDLDNSIQPDNICSNDEDRNIRNVFDGGSNLAEVKCSPLVRETKIFDKNKYFSSQFYANCRCPGAEWRRSVPVGDDPTFSARSSWVIRTGLPAGKGRGAHLPIVIFSLLLPCCARSWQGQWREGGKRVKRCFKANLPMEKMRPL